jgi:hypothetical protein
MHMLTFVDIYCYPQTPWCSWLGQRRAKTSEVSCTPSRCLNGKSKSRPWFELPSLVLWLLRSIHTVWLNTAHPCPAGLHNSWLVVNVLHAVLPACTHKRLRTCREPHTDIESLQVSSKRGCVAACRANVFPQFQAHKNAEPSHA